MYIFPAVAMMTALGENDDNGEQSESIGNVEAPSVEAPTIDYMPGVNMSVIVDINVACAGDSDSE